MGKRHLALLLACVAPVLPVVAFGGDETAKLRDELAATVRSIAELTGLAERIAARDPRAVSEVLAASEPAPADPVQAELELARLRSRVGQLQEIVDARALENGETPPPRRTQDVSLIGAPGPNSASDVLRDAGETHVKRIAFEPDGFVADRALLGRACWRGGRYQEGVAALEPQAGLPQADYWRARCLEKLGRSTDAIAVYRKVIEAAPESPEGKSAREDLDFLEWCVAHGLADQR